MTRIGVVSISHRYRGRRALINVLSAKVRRYWKPAKMRDIKVTMQCIGWHILIIIMSSKRSSSGSSSAAKEVVRL